MKNIVYIIIFFSVLVTYGCAGTSEIQKLRSEFNQLKIDTQNKYVDLHNDMSMFKNAYNPELQEMLSQNLLTAEEHRKSIEAVKNDMENISGKMHNLLSESENDRVLISENLKTSTSENIVNEFRYLNYQWAATVNELSNIVKNSEKAAELSRRAAIRAAGNAGSSERSADYALESMNLIKEQTKSLNKVQRKIRDIEQKIRKISQQLNKVEETEQKTKSKSRSHDK